ncbi:6785_t:CDS:2 [Diversispora eburnea]|uniref:6785_t:CDS:1 n=1 Tax=Diversispora eburnea TaxID=1213867 RepID=A0A9N9A4E2_9GLOM|nr:6785_t:CDS:2 [Diversispora eburnea]
MKFKDVNVNVTMNDDDDKFSKPYDKTEQTYSGTTNQVAHTKTAFDKNNVKPENEIEEMKKFDKQESLEWSAANKQISDQTNSKSFQPVEK